MINKSGKVFKKIQDDLLIGCYDKKFQQIKNKEEAKAFLEELRGLDKERVQYVKRTFDEKSHKHKIEVDSTFEDYYSDKLKKISKEFEFTEQEIEELLFSRYIDKKVLSMDSKKKEEKINSQIYNYLYNKKIEQDNKNPLDEQCKVIRFEMDKGANFIFYIDKQNNVFYEKAVYGLMDEYEVENRVDENLSSEELLRKFQEGEYGGREIQIDVKKIIEEEAAKETRLTKLGRYKTLLFRRLAKIKQKIINREKNIITYDKENRESGEEGLQPWDLRNWENKEISVDAKKIMRVKENNSEQVMSNEHEENDGQH